MTPRELLAAHPDLLDAFEARNADLVESTEAHLADPITKRPLEDGSVYLTIFGRAGRFFAAYLHRSVNFDSSEDFGMNVLVPALAALLRLDADPDAAGTGTLRILAHFPVG